MCADGAQCAANTTLDAQSKKVKIVIENFWYALCEIQGGEC
jgi:hypothetical protein